MFRNSLSAGRSTRLRRLGVVGFAVALVAGSLVISAAATPSDLVSLPGSKFEIDVDANLRVDHADLGFDDWASVTETRKADSPSGSSDESFGQGTKEDTAVPTVVDGSIPPNKSDFSEFQIAFQTASSGDTLLYLDWT